MSGIFTWDERFSVGIEEIDDQHKKLFEIIDTVFEGVAEREDRKRLEEAFDKIIEYTRYHFATEERFFEIFHYPDAEEHKKRHAELLKQTLALKEEHCNGAPGISLELIDFLSQWLQKHILLHDKEYAPFLKEKLE